MENKYGIPTMEDIKAQYEEIIGYMEKLHTKEDVLEFQKRHNVPMEINYEECELYDKELNEIEVIRCEHWGDLDYIYYYTEHNKERCKPTFDVWSDFMDLDFIDSTNIDRLEEDYVDGIKCITEMCNYSAIELHNIKMVLDKQGLDSSFLPTYNIDFLDDNEKMYDFFRMDKEEFLNFYSYLTEEEYDATMDNLYVGKITDYITYEDIDLFEKLITMEEIEISTKIYKSCYKHGNFKKIEETVWSLLNDNESKFSNLETYRNLSPGYDPNDVKDLYSADLFNCDLLYMTAISMVLGLEIPNDSCDIHIYGL